MQINLYIVIPVIIALATLVAWLVYRNMRDEKDFEREADEKDDLPTEEEIKNRHF